jgi:lipopolysaccharide/colanic/teichoic acid biosynthesis glycosyltransferase
MLPKMASELSEEQRERMGGTPGMTGWAQVNGNTALSWDERIALDIWYLHHQSIWLDLKILGKTVAVVFLGEQPNEEALHEVGLRRSR